MKALQFNITIPNYLILQLLGRLNKKFYYDGPFSTVKLSEVPEPKSAQPGLGQDQDTALRILRERPEPPHGERFPHGIAVYLLPLHFRP